MSTIQAKQRTVYSAPTRGRDYLTLNGAVMAEAAAQIAKKYPIEKEVHYELLTQDVEFIGRFAYDEEGFVRLRDRLARFLKRQYRRSGITGGIENGTTSIQQRQRV